MGKARDLANVGSVASTGLQFRNKIINGHMVVDQRNNGNAVTSQSYLVDRWRTWFDPGTYSFQQVTDAPPGFSHSLRVTKTNTTQSNYGIILQHIEGFNIADLAWGTANAQPVALSFWVKSSVTGTFTVSLTNADSATRSYLVPYTVNQANTWEQKIAMIPGSTSGTWLTNNGTGLQVKFNFGSGVAGGSANTWLTGDFGVATGATANLGTTNGATLQITGVQLEKGTQATPFEHRPYGTELSLCQRYFQIVPFMGIAVNTGELGCLMPVKVQMRATASFNTAIRNGTDYTGTLGMDNWGVAFTTISGASFGTTGQNGCLNFYATTSPTLVAGRVYGGSTQASAEL